MSIAIARTTLLWCTVANFAVLLTWSLLYLSLHQWGYQLTSRWFRLTTGQFDTINFAGILFYKVGIILFNLVPYVALSLAG